MSSKRGNKTNLERTLHGDSLYSWLWRYYTMDPPQWILPSPPQDFRGPVLPRPAFTWMLVNKLRPLCLPRNHCTDWAISSAPHLIFFQPVIISSWFSPVILFKFMCFQNCLFLPRWMPFTSVFISQFISSLHIGSDPWFNNWAISKQVRQNLVWWWSLVLKLSSTWAALGSMSCTEEEKNQMKALGVYLSWETD